MAEISLRNIRHSYSDCPADDADWALKELNTTWADGTAYALLGPSGCGKTTLLNIISGLISPTQGRVLFDGRDVTDISTGERHIAQVFQFPVVYDTMTVYDNLAFPLRNRGVNANRVSSRVAEISGMLDLDGMLQRKARGLTADGKQKISLGRGLVREDVNVIMFDEPLTVIDPHLKWQLRSKLKELHQRVGMTMIYVTHDQTEALTFADRVVVIHEGTVVQIGTPVELFERPKHTFVGHFIGSPGMNFLPCEAVDGSAMFDGTPLQASNSDKMEAGGGTLELGIRPEFVRFDKQGFDVEILRVDDLGRYQLVIARRENTIIKVILAEGNAVPSENPRLSFEAEHACLYSDGWALG